MGHRLIELQPDPGNGDGEHTLYVKGFLARGEDPERFREWHGSHRRLVGERGWSATASGVAWDSGELGGWPLPLLSTAKTVYDVVRSVRHAGRSHPAGFLGMMAAEHLVRLTARFVMQYRSAQRASLDEADALAETFGAIGARHPEWRVVAHSLGCRLVIEALSRLSPDDRPAEVHLCAPALLEEDVADRLARLGRRGAWLYHARNDLVLETGFRALSFGRALGAVGPVRDHPGLEAVDVSDRFGFWVHHEYKRRFSEFARPLGAEPEADRG